VKIIVNRRQELNTVTFHISALDGDLGPHHTARVKETWIR